VARRGRRVTSVERSGLDQTFLKPPTDVVVERGHRSCAIVTVTASTPATRSTARSATCLVEPLDQAHEGVPLREGAPDTGEYSGRRGDVCDPPAAGPAARHRRRGT